MRAVLRSSLDVCGVCAFVHLFDEKSYAEAVRSLVRSARLGFTVCSIEAAAPRIIPKLSQF